MMFVPKFLIPVAVVCLLVANTVQAQVSGCTDPAANNYNSSATLNNGSCTYNALTLSPTLTSNLVTALQENSGMVYWNNKIWSINDGGSLPQVFQLSETGAIERTITISNASNVDWEDIAQDDTYFYIGDFGNNASGNRTNLRIYRVLRSDVAANLSVTADIINFSYADQTDFTAVAANTTNFDCEAMIVLNGKAYLFMKQWTSLGTSVYEVPLTPGTVQATRIATRTDPNWLVTGADVMPGQRSIVLTGYNSGGNRFLYLLYDYTGTNFFSGNRRLVNLSGIRQTEGVAFRDQQNIFITSERLVAFGTITISTQSLETLDLSAQLGSYYLQLLPIEYIDLKLSPVNMGNRISWDVIPADELAMGWVQRRDAADRRYTNIHSFTESRGWYDDVSGAGNVYYRIKAKDKDGRESYSREYRLASTARTATLIRSGNMLLPGSLTASIEVYGMNGNRVLHGKGSLDISTLPGGMYVALGLSTNGEVVSRSTFIR